MTIDPCPNCNFLEMASQPVGLGMHTHPYIANVLGLTPNTSGWS